MNTPLTLAPTRQQDRTVSRHDRPLASGAPGPVFAPVVIRLATAADRPTLDYLAELDSAKRPIGMTLIGELGGRPVVALQLSDGSVIADPFLATSEVSELLALRAKQLTRRQAKQQRSGRSRRLRRAALRVGAMRRAVGVA